MTSRKKNLVVLVSGGGTNMAAILNSIDLGEINGEVKAVISSNAEAYALVRAKERGIPAYVCARKDYPSGIERDCEIMRICDECKADYILLAGYLGILSPFLTEKYAYKIINIHPALLPKFGGKGFFGINVHKAVIDAGESESGATVHFVDGGTDTGLIIAQGKVKVEKGDTPEDLQKRILDNVEHKLFPEVVCALCADEIEVKNGKIITKQSYTNKIKGENNMKKRALISVSDKTGVVEFARGLTELGYEIISTGGTAKALTDAGVKNIGISDITGFPECLDGRVKTLHPAVHAGLLARRDVPEHIEQLKKLNINTIDIVAVNLYPFKQTILKEGATLEDAIENIDIGGPTMIRSAAKNYRDVCVIVDPADYGEVLNRLKDNTLTVEFKFGLMYKVFQHTAVYDTMISTYMREKLGLRFPNQITFAYEKKQDMRYGENPQQNAAFYAEALPVAGSLPQAEQLQGKELSYNNINDTNGALELLHEFTETAVVACKHANPCGVGTGKTVCEAYKTAYECDPVSIFGGIVAVNRTVDGDTAREMVKIFLEIVVAPDFTDEALEIFKAKPNLRVLKLKDINAARNANAYDMKKVYGGLLIQDCDRTLFNGEDVKTVTKRKPTKDEMKQLEFAFKVVKHAKSNAIAIVKDNAAIGVGGGQTNRIWAAQQAIEHAGERVKGAVLASDAFFPFSDCVEAAAKAGITAIIQPGGSVRDQESIEACDKYGIAMIFVGQRHFKH